MKASEFIRFVQDSELEDSEMFVMINHGEGKYNVLNLVPLQSSDQKEWLCLQCVTWGIELKKADLPQFVSPDLKEALQQVLEQHKEQGLEAPYVISEKLVGDCKLAVGLLWLTNHDAAKGMIDDFKEEGIDLQD